MKRYFTPYIEGYTIGSKKIIEVARLNDIDAEVFSVEPWTFKKEGFSKFVFNSLFAENYYISDLISATYFSLLSKNNSFDIIHFLPNLAGDLYSLFLTPKIKENTKIIGHFSHPYHPYIESPFSRFRLNYISHNVFDYVFCINEFLVKYFIEHTKINPSRIFYVPFPIDTDRYKPAPNKERLRERFGLGDDFIIAYVGQIEPVRGVFVLLEAIKKIMKQLSDVKLVISNPGLEFENPYKNLLQKKIKEYSLEDKIVLLPAQKRVEDIYNLANVVVFPYIKPYYYMDPPLTLLEAMSCGSLVLGSSVGTVKDLIINNKNGISIKPNDVASLSKQLINITKNIDDYKNLGGMARESIISTYSMKKVGNTLKETYNMII